MHVNVVRAASSRAVDSIATLAARKARAAGVHAGRLLHRARCGFHIARGVVTPTLCGLRPRFRVSSRVEVERALDARGEAPVLCRFLAALSEGDVVLDAGANTGVYTLTSALMLRGTGAVLAFEPHPPTRRRLEENVAMNDVPNVDVFDVALSDQAGHATLYDRGGEGCGSSSLLSDSRPYSDTHVIETRRLDEFLESRGMSVPNVAKIDVEGTEVALLEGMDEILADPGLRSIFCEVHPELGPGGDPDRVRDILKRSGFDVEAIEDTVGKTHLVASKETPLDRSETHHAD